MNIICGFFVFFLMFFLLTSVFSQQNPNVLPVNPSPVTSGNQEPCAAGLIEQQMIQNDPNYAQIRSAIEAQTQLYIQQQSSSRAAGVVYTIPIVFHVMHEGEAI